MTFSHDGDLHSEKNGSPDEPMRFIQFWILPSARGLATTDQQQQHTFEERTDRWLQIMGPDGTDGLDLAQDARAMVSHLTDAGRLEHTFGPGRGGYLYVVDGRLSLNGDQLRTGDAAKVTGERSNTSSGSVSVALRGNDRFVTILERDHIRTGLVSKSDASDPFARELRIDVGERRFGLARAVVGRKWPTVNGGSPRLLTRCQRPGS